MSNIKELEQVSREGRYDRSRDPETGKWSANAGDFVIEMTKHLNNQQMAELTAAIVGCHAGDLTASYIYMNQGMMRMNINNKLRHTLIAKNLEYEVRVKNLTRALEKTKQKASEADFEEATEYEDKIQFIEYQLDLANKSLESRPSSESVLRSQIDLMGL